MDGLGKTIKNGHGFERVRLTAEELEEVHQETMDYNLAVMRECIERAAKQFSDVEPARQLQIALLLAGKACIARYTVEREKLDTKVSAIKDAENGKGQKPPASSSAHGAQGTSERLKSGFSQEIPVLHMDDAPKPGDIVDGWEVISSYSTKQAVEDGVLVPVGNVWGEPVYMTSNLMAQGYADEQKRLDLINQGLELLGTPDPEDTPYMRLRVIEPNHAWIIFEQAEPGARGKYTLLSPEDY